MILKIIGIVYLLSIAICIYEYKHAVVVDPKAKFLHDDFM